MVDVGFSRIGDVVADVRIALVVGLVVVVVVVCCCVCCRSWRCCLFSLALMWLSLM